MLPKLQKSMKLKFIQQEIRARYFMNLALFFTNLYRKLQLVHSNFKYYSSISHEYSIPICSRKSQLRLLYF